MSQPVSLTCGQDQQRLPGQSSPAATERPLEREPGERRRNLLRWICLPYCWLVVIPYTVVSTIVMGCLAVLLCVVGPRLAFHCGTIWAWLLCRLSLVRVEVSGRRNATRGQSYIIMSNHQSQFDILAFYGHWGRQFRWVMKKELRKVPGLGWYCAAGGHIFLDRASHQRSVESLRAARPLLEGGISVVMFPEGTRSRDGRLQAFKKGGFMMALEMGLPILPVSISGSRHVLPAGSSRLLPGSIRIKVHPPIDPAHYGLEGRARLMADVRAAIASGLTPWERGEEAIG
jgi:1-acyl-sn-glycerol-3-phosphate acyltransferase